MVTESIAGGWDETMAGLESSFPACASGSRLSLKNGANLSRWWVGAWVVIWLGKSAGRSQSGFATSLLWAVLCLAAQSTRSSKAVIGDKGLILMRLLLVLKSVFRPRCRFQSPPFIPKPMESYAGRPVWIIVRPMFATWR